VCLQVFLSLGRLQQVLNGRHEWLFGDFKNFFDGACSCDSLRCCKIWDVSLKLDSTVFNRFHIDLTGVEVGIREVSNDEFDRSRLSFSSSSPKKNVSFSPDSTSDFSSTVFSTIFFKSSTMGLSVFPT